MARKSIMSKVAKLEARKAELDLIRCSGDISIPEEVFYAACDEFYAIELEIQDLLRGGKKTDSVTRELISMNMD